MPSRHPHDPFTDSALRTTTLNPSIRAQTSSQSLRSNASTASARTRQPGTELFAPSLSRRPTSRTTPRFEDDVLADPDSDDQAPPLQPRLRHATRRTRHVSPEKLNRSRVRLEDEAEMVNRQADGSFLLDGNLMNDCYAQHMADPLLVEAKNDEGKRELSLLDNPLTVADLLLVQRTTLTTPLSAVSTLPQEWHKILLRLAGLVEVRPYQEIVLSGVIDQYDPLDPSELATEVMAHVRRRAMKSLQEEQWRFEPADRYQAHYS